MANQPVEVKSPTKVEQVDKEEARIQIRQERDRVDALEKQLEELRGRADRERRRQNEIYSTRRLEALDLAIKLNPAPVDLISLAEQIYQFLTKDLTGNKI